MTFGKSINTCLNKYATFEGRASRSKYWFLLFTFLALAAAAPVSNAAGSLVLLALSLPCLAVGVRRLHDSDKTGWWLILGAIPLVNLLLLYWLVQAGTDGANPYGITAAASA